MSVPYPTNPYPRAHPDRLQAIATLYGMSPIDVCKARILELGCGDGGQLIPMAQQLPDAVIIGVDIDKSAIKRAKEKSVELGITNIQWHCASIANWSPPKADYILAHGLYSWVPDAVRAEVWQCIQKSLSPNGVAFISHICLPGGHLRAVARSVMLSAAKPEMSEREKVASGITALSEAVELHGEESVLGGVLKSTLQAVMQQDWGYVWHDFWVSGYAAFSLSSLNHKAKQHGLQYLQDADLRVNMPMGVPETIAKKIQEQSDLVSAGHLLDTYLGRSFRRGLWVNGSLDLKISLAALDDMWIRAQYERHETDEGVLLVTESGQQLGFRGQLAVDLTARIQAVPECSVISILGEHPVQTRQWLFSLFAAGALSISVRSRCQVYPQGQGLNGQQQVVNCFHEPVRLSFFDAAILNVIGGGFSGFQLIEQLVEAAQRGDFEARIDGRQPESIVEWRQIIQGALPNRIELLWQKGLLASPQIFEGV